MILTILFVAAAVANTLMASPYVRMIAVNEWLNKVDTNNDSYLNGDEIFDALKEHHTTHLDRIDMVHRWQTPEWIEVFHEQHGWDMNTFLSYRQNHSTKPSSPEDKKLEMDIFTKADINKDNILSKEEYVNLLRGHGDDELREKISELEFSKADKNKNNKLSFRELIEHINPKSEYHEESIAKIFEKVDKNKDDFLEKEELLELNNQLLKEHLHHDVEHFMESVDDDEDKKISLNELRKHTKDLNLLWTRSDDDEEIYHFLRDDEL